MARLEMGNLEDKAEAMRITKKRPHHSRLVELYGVCKIKVFNKEMNKDQAQRPRRIIIPEVIDKGQPWAYFDGSAQPEGCRGAVLNLNVSVSFKMKLGLGLGRGANNFAKLNRSRHFLLFAK